LTLRYTGNISDEILGCSFTLKKFIIIKIDIKLKQFMFSLNLVPFK